MSNDLGAIAGLLFDIGSGRYGVTPAGTDADWKSTLAQVVAENAAAAKARALAESCDHTHPEIQGWLRDLGLALGYDVAIASNDKSRTYAGGQLSDGCVVQLPEAIRHSPAADTISLIDCLWLSKTTSTIVAAFEVEHSTSIYSGIVRMLDLALGADDGMAGRYFLVAPDRREEDARAQVARPAFRRVADMDLRFLPYSELKTHRESIARFGQGLRPIDALARPLR